MIVASPVAAKDLRLGLPAMCKLGTECFFQNFADLDPSSAVRDPWCGEATYDGHKGTDIRLRSMSDIGKNIPVIASASGRVKAVRDGEPDKLVRSDADRMRVAGKECGNGLVLSHGNGYETQYCHLKQGSILVRQGEAIEAGQHLGSIGSSGLSQFPHVHLSLRKAGEWIDPVSGLKSAEKCGNVTQPASYFTKNAYDKLPIKRRQLLSFGLSGTVFEHGDLVKFGGPPTANRMSQNIVGWVWFINLQEGDELSLTLQGPEGIISQSTTEALDRHKADYSAFTGRKRKPSLGSYQLKVVVLNKGMTVFSSSNAWSID